MAKPKSAKKQRVITLHKTLSESNPSKVFVINGPVVEINTGFKQTEKHSMHSIHNRPIYNPARDNPAFIRRPGSLDAFKLPSVSFEGLKAPVHHNMEN